MAKAKTTPELFVYRGHQYTADRLPAGVKISDTVPVGEWFQKNRRSEYVPSALEDSTMPSLAAPLNQDGPGATDTPPSEPDSREGHGEASLADLGYPELKELAREMGLDFPGNIRKDDLLALIEKA